MWQLRFLVHLWELAGVEKDVFSISDTDGRQATFDNLALSNV